MFQNILTLSVAVLSIATGIFVEIRTTLIHEMRSLDLTAFASLKRMEACNGKERETEREIAKKYLAVSESYRLNAIYMNFVALFTFFAVISSVISLLVSNFSVFLMVSVLFFGFTILFCVLAILAYLGGRYRYFGIGVLDKVGWRIAELVIPNFAGGARRDKDVTDLINRDVEIKRFVEELEDNKRIRRFLRYSGTVVFP